MSEHITPVSRHVALALLLSSLLLAMVGGGAWWLHRLEFHGDAGSYLLEVVALLLILAALSRTNERTRWSRTVRPTVVSLIGASVNAVLLIMLAGYVTVHGYRRLERTPLDANLRIIATADSVLLLNSMHAMHRRPEDTAGTPVLAVTAQMVGNAARSPTLLLASAAMVMVHAPTIHPLLAMTAGLLMVWTSLSVVGTVLNNSAVPPGG